MTSLRALLFALSLFGALGVISLIVAAIMRSMYSILHKVDKNGGPENKTESGAVSQ
jgi:hypothetical protein